MSRFAILLPPPCTNASLHLGHLSGVYIPGDVYARYLSLQGHDVLTICGSDQNNTYTKAKAEALSISFDEGNPAHIIEVTTTKQMPQLDSSPSLQFSSHSNETGIYSYKLALRDRDSARELDQALRKEDGVQQSLVRYSNYL